MARPHAASPFDLAAAPPPHPATAASAASCLFTPPFSPAPVRRVRPPCPQVVSYIYFTRIVVYLLKSTTPYQYVWLSDCAGEMATLAFYCFTGFKFRPVSQNPYFHLEMDELDEAEQELVRRAFGCASFRVSVIAFACGQLCLCPAH